MKKYIHDEWCQIYSKEGECGCYVAILKEKDILIKHKEEIIQQLGDKLDAQALVIKKLEVSRAELKIQNKELRR